VLFVGDKTMEVQYRTRLSGNSRSQKFLGIEWLLVGQSRIFGKTTK